jgi:hypothetical protein
MSNIECRNKMQKAGDHIFNMLYFCNSLQNSTFVIQYSIFCIPFSFLISLYFTSKFNIRYSIFNIHYFASGLFCISTSGNANVTLPGTGLRFGNLITALTPLMVCATRLVRTISNQRFASPINS